MRERATLQKLLCVAVDRKMKQPRNNPRLSVLSVVNGPVLEDQAGARRAVKCRKNGACSVIFNPRMCFRVRHTSSIASTT